MPRVTFLLPDGGETTVEADPGASVMETAVARNVPGIVAECGGAAMCATCHVYVEPEFMAALPEMNGYEDEMLECTAAERRENSRLGCQIALGDPALDGLRVRVPERQR